MRVDWYYVFSSVFFFPARIVNTMLIANSQAQSKRLGGVHKFVWQARTYRNIDSKPFLTRLGEDNRIHVRREEALTSTVWRWEVECCESICCRNDFCSDRSMDESEIVVLIGAGTRRVRMALTFGTMF